MNNLFLYYSHCKECGKCCFNCEFLDPKIGCINDEYRLNTRCASFPLIQGDPKQMGHKNLYDFQKEEKSKEMQKQWFIYHLENCLILQNEIIFNNLRWIVEDINRNQKLNFFFMSYGEENLMVSPE